MILGSQAKKTSQLLQLSVNFFPNLIITFAGYFKIYAFHSVLPNIHFVFMSITYQFDTSISFFFSASKTCATIARVFKRFSLLLGDSGEIAVCAWLVACN